MKNLTIVMTVALFFTFTPSYSAIPNCLEESLPNNKSSLDAYDGSNPYWHCIAISNSGWGEGGGLTESIAIENALYNCKIDGYFKDVCHVDHCGVQ